MITTEYEARCFLVVSETPADLAHSYTRAPLPGSLDAKRATDGDDYD